MRAPLSLLITLAVAATAHAELVTIRGSGTTTGFAYRIDSPFEQGSATPEGLVDLFPVGETFDVELTYDSQHITIDMSPGLPDQSYFLGPPIAMTLRIGDDTITPNTTLPPDFDPYLSYLSVRNDFDVGASFQDALEGGFIYTLLDGSSGLVAGRYHMESAGVGIYDGEATALTGIAIPTQVCLAAFETLTIGAWFNPLEASGIRYLLVGVGVPDRGIDSDGDGILDGEELALRLTLPALDPCDADSDDDGLPDGAEIATGTSPVDGDTDGDGLPDATDPDPLVPVSTVDEIADDVRDAAAGVLEIPEGEFAAPNGHAQRGRRNAFANCLQSAANEIDAGNLEEALATLRHARELLDGDPSPPDVMEDGAAKDALLAEIDALIALLEDEL